MSSLIKISKLSKSFEGIKKINVLKNISYNFKKGKIYSLMGPSGSGKSTLLNLLSLIDRPSSGSIIFENKIYLFLIKYLTNIFGFEYISISINSFLKIKSYYFIYMGTDLKQGLTNLDMLSFYLIDYIFRDLKIILKIIREQ